jgi:hypothetical protein
MWNMTKIGFYSAVQHRDQPDTLLIRARSQQDLLNLNAYADSKGLASEASPPRQTPDADYPWRLTIPKADFAKLRADLVVDIDYDNFKNAVAAEPCNGFDRAHTYGNVWSVLHQIEDEDTAGVYTPPKGGMGRRPGDT